MSFARKRLPSASVHRGLEPGFTVEFALLLPALEFRPRPLGELSLCGRGLLFEGFREACAQRMGRDDDLQNNSTRVNTMILQGDSSAVYVCTRSE